MPIITDPDFLNQGTEVIFDTTNRKIKLQKEGNLSDDGVTLQCIYSFCKEEWLTDPELIKYPFPILAITEEKFELINGWDWADEETKLLIRTGGWALNDNGVIVEEYACIITLGELGEGQAYYQQYPDGPAINFHLKGPVNQAVKIYGDANHGNINYRSYLKLFCREQGYTYAAAGLEDIGVTTMTYQAYRFPLAITVDSKIIASDTQIIGEQPYFGAATASGNDGSVTANSNTFTSSSVTFTSSDVGKFICIKTGPNSGIYRITSIVSDHEVQVDRNFSETQSGITFTVNPVGMSIKWYSTPQTRKIGENTYNFHVIVDGNGGSAEAIYTFVQYLLRQNHDIDFGDGVKIGKTTPQILKFIGDNLYTFRWTEGEGTYIDNHRKIDRVRLYFLPDTGEYVQFPFVAILTINFGDNLVNDSDAIYRVFFSEDYGTADALIVNTADKINAVSRSRSGNVAIIETAEPHGLSVGDGIEVSGFTDESYNGIYIVESVISETKFTYKNNGSDEDPVEDTNGIIIRQMAGKVNGRSSIQLTFDYENNSQGGRTPGTDANITAVAIGLSTAQFVLATGKIERSLSNVVTLVAALERNYVNP